jgi:lipid-A-disaccharide synthase
MKACLPDTQIPHLDRRASRGACTPHGMTALRARADVQLFGMGGLACAKPTSTGRRLLGVALVGIVESQSTALRRVFFVLGEANRRKPDSPSSPISQAFISVSRAPAEAQGVPCVYFVCPQFWAWRPWRANLVRRRFVRALCIFPFEEQWYRSRGVKADFIGHPLVGHVAPQSTREQFASANQFDATKPILTLLPGSRSGEIAHHMPTLMEACRIIQEHQDVQFVLALAPGVERSQIRRTSRRTCG